MSKIQIEERIKALRQLMQERKIDAYLIPTGDFHESEYVGDYFKCRAFMSGFTGSAGTLVVCAHGQAGLWTDGRYFLQAAQQLEGTGITLFKMGEKDVPSIPAFLNQVLKTGDCLGFDGRVVSFREVEEIREAFGEKQVQLHVTEDLVDLIWKDRPALSKEPIWILSEKYAGKSRSKKLFEVRKSLADTKADYLILTSLDDIAWLLNLRGGDVAYNPVFLAFLKVSKEECVLYSFLEDEAVKEVLQKDGISFADYDAIYEDVSKLKGRIWLDEKRVNCALCEAVSEEAEIYWAENPTLLPKAIKNPVEVKNERLAHVKDGVAVTKFLYWLKTAEDVVTEIGVAEKLETFRQKQEHYLGQSFDPIAAFGSHGAIVHYSATEESDVALSKGSFLLLDTGGQYLEGTTDITRTVCIGEVSAEAKRYYTLVLKGNLHLLNAVFMKGARGANLDVLAREPLWREGLDYNHGTGHGVGFLLNVHESPNNFRFRIPKNLDNFESAVMEPGMITSDEPGLYLAGKYGIRLENLIVCVTDRDTEFGSFLKFEPLTLVPFDREAIDTDLLTQEEKDWLNAYHKQVYDTIAPSLTEEEQRWLGEVTAEIE